MTIPDPIHGYAANPVAAALSEAAAARAERQAREMTAELPEAQRDMLKLKGMIE